VIAGGKRASAAALRKIGAKGYLLPSFDPCIDNVDIRLNDVVTVFMAIHIRHVLPDHPSMVGDDVVMITGPLTGHVRKVIKIDAGLFTTRVAGSRNHDDETTHSRRELALVKIMPCKKKNRRR